jgi:hypothetical protein
METSAADVRKKLKEDFEFYAEKALKIRTKKGDIVPFIINRQQKLLDDTIEAELKAKGQARIILLKARQLGMSTYTAGRMTHRITNDRGKLAMVVAHDSESTETLFVISQRMFENLPQAIKPTTKYSSKRELFFDKLDSRYVVGTAGSASIGRGSTIQYLHCSEIAFWPKKSAKELYNGLEQAVPYGHGSIIIVESTANGTSGLYYDMWNSAVKGENGFTPIFFPWYEAPEYRRPVPSDFERTPDEEVEAAKYGLDDEQLCFRREKIGLNGLDKFKQEYPATPEEAFISTGMGVFNPTHLQFERERAAPLIMTKIMFGEKWEERRGGPLHIYKEHEPSQEYWIGADSSMGIRGGDPSFLVILDEQKEVVATYRDWVHPDHFANIIFRLATLYNNAHVIVESNSHGLLVCTRIYKDWEYPNFYTEEVVDKITDQLTIKLGFTTSPKSKPYIIDKLRAEVRDKAIKLNCPMLMNDMRTFIATPEGKYEAEPGAHDDGVMALALANHYHRGKWTPVLDQETYLLEAI